MPKADLLPGVTTPKIPPAVVCDARSAVLKARHRAMIRDGVQLFLLLAIDWLLLRWADARLPFLDRSGSITLLLWVNIAMLGGIWLARTLPRWSARRIATSWCAAERRRFQRSR